MLTLKGAVESIVEELESYINSVVEVKVKEHLQLLQQVNEKSFNYLNKTQAKNYLGVSFNTLKRYEKEGLEFSMVGGKYFITKEALDEFVESQKIYK